MRLLLAALCLLPALAWASLFTSSSNDFLPVDKAFSFSQHSLPDGALQVQWDIAPGYYLYRDRMQFSGLQPDWQPAWRGAAGAALGCAGRPLYDRPAGWRLAVYRADR